MGQRVTRGHKLLLCVPCKMFPPRLLCSLHHAFFLPLILNGLAAIFQLPLIPFAFFVEKLSLSSSSMMLGSMESVVTA